MDSLQTLSFVLSIGQIHVITGGPRGGLRGLLTHLNINWFIT